MNNIIIDKNITSELIDDIDENINKLNLNNKVDIIDNLNLNIIDDLDKTPIYADSTNLFNDDIIIISNYTGNFNSYEKIPVDLKQSLWKNRENLYCNNCGKNGHTIKRCYEPIITYGIICLNINLNNNQIYSQNLSNKKIFDFFINKYKFPQNSQQLKNICINKYILKNISCNNRKDLDLFEDIIINNIEYLLVKRKQTYNYIYLIKGLYKIDLENIINSINLLTQYEYNKFITNDFDILWKDILGDNCFESNLLYDYLKAKEKYIFFKKYIFQQIQHKINIIYNDQEWEFPKGKKNNNESNIKCIKREFYEETGIDESKYEILDRLVPLIENIKGSNGINYKHIYYIALLKSNTQIETIKLNFNINHNFKIGDIGLYSINKISNKLRDYNTERKEIINNLKLFFIYNTRYFEKFYHDINY